MCFSDINYNIFRADAACATNPTFPSTPVGSVPPGVGSFTDNTVTLQGSYCYFVQTDDGIVTANSGLLPVIFDTTSPSNHIDADRRKRLRAIHGQRDRDRQPDVDHDDC